MSLVFPNLEIEGCLISSGINTIFVRVATTANGTLASAYANTSVVDGVTLAI